MVRILNYIILIFTLLIFPNLGHASNDCITFFLRNLTENPYDKVTYTTNNSSKILNNGVIQNFIGILVKKKDGSYILGLTEALSGHEELVIRLNSELTEFEEVLWGGEILLDGQGHVLKMNETSGFVFDEMKKVQEKRHPVKVPYSNNAALVKSLLLKSPLKKAFINTEVIPFQTEQPSQHLFPPINAWPYGNYRHRFLNQLNIFNMQDARRIPPGHNYFPRLDDNEAHTIIFLRDIQIGLKIIPEMLSYDPTIPIENINSLNANINTMIENRTWTDQNRKTNQIDVMTISNFLKLRKALLEFIEFRVTELQ